MEREFSRVRSIKDILISSLLIISGCVLVTLPTSESINILGFFLIGTGIILAIFLRSGYKDQLTGKNIGEEVEQNALAFCPSLLVMSPLFFRSATVFAPTG